MRLTLPDFPWDTIAQARALALSHPGGGIDLSIGTPVDETPAVIRQALVDHANSPGYPPALGSADLCQAIAQFYARRRAVPGVDPAAIVATVGSKELVASLPLQLGLGAGHTVGFPDVSYPTYEVGARLAGAHPVRLPYRVDQWPTGEAAPDLVWLNSPANPSGRVDTVEYLRQVVTWARQNGAILVADECYALLCWQGPYAYADAGAGNWDAYTGAPSLLDPRVCDGDFSGLLVAHSLSKQSNFAGYRGAWLLGDAKLVGRVGQVRKHWGLMVPSAVQAAMVAALGDDSHLDEQIGRYQARRQQLLAATASFGLENSVQCRGGLYLWLRDPRGRYTGRQLVQILAELGILCAPGDFYGPAGRDYVRMSLTATDQQITQAAQRLANNSALG